MGWSHASEDETVEQLLDLAGVLTDRFLAGK